ncbi:MAG: glycosyltransferase, partial [Gemmatimonadetes bacterium]|nr:glycosyltransferase [Gemmatimonadota bacterium]
MPHIRVHRVIARMNVGGPALHVTHLSQALASHCRTTLVVGAPGPGERDMTDHARSRGIDVRVVPSLGPELRAGHDVRALWTLVRLFRRERPHIVHSHTAKAGALARMAAVAAGVPVRIHTFHGHVLGGHYFSPRRTRFYRELERQLARVTQRIVVLSAAQRHELSEDLGVAPGSAFRVIPLGLDLARFRRLDPSARGPAK